MPFTKEECNSLLGRALSFCIQVHSVACVCACVCVCRWRKKKGVGVSQQVVGANGTPSGLSGVRLGGARECFCAL